MQDLIKLYEKIYELTVEQKKVIKEDDYIALLKVLEEKQFLIEEIDKIDSESYKKEQDDPDSYLEKLKSTLKKAKELEDENAKMIEERHVVMKNKLKDVNTRQKSRKGYQGSIKYEAKFLDKKG